MNDDTRTGADSRAGAPGERVDDGAVDPAVDRDAETQRFNRRLGDFELLEKIGQGGMGEVYRGRQVSLDRPVALKLLPESFAKKAQFLERFKREARAAANLVHPNVLQVFAYGVEDGKAYIAMEFVEGEDLSDRLKRERLPLDEAVRVIRDAALALGAAGDKGIVHRDIKPSNIMIRSDGAVKVMDFGLAKATSDAEEGLTEAGLVVGTPKYISPEQGRGEQLDPRSDIYSLGISFYELLTGQTPFAADTSTALIYKHVFEAPLPPRSLNPDIPPFLEDVVLRAIAKRADERYASAHELARDLEEFQRHKDDYVASGRRRAAAGGDEDDERPLAPVVVQTASGPALALAGAAVLLALVAIGLSFRAPRGGTTRVVVGAEAREVPEVAFTWALDLPRGTTVTWNALGEPSRLEPGVEYRVPSGRATVVLERTGYAPRILEVAITPAGATLADGTPLGQLDLRFQPTEALVRAYEEGRQALEARDYDLSVRLLERAAAHDEHYRPAADRPSAKELLERARALQEREVSLLRQRRRGLRHARRLHEEERDHRAALSALATLPIAFDRRGILELRGRCQDAISRATAELELARSRVAEGALLEAEERLERAGELDPEHPELRQATAFVTAAAGAWRQAREPADDPRVAIARVEEYLRRYGKRDEPMTARLADLRAEAAARDERARLLRLARARLQLAAEREAWDEVREAAGRILDELDPADAEARDLLARAGVELKTAAIRRAMDQLDRACEGLSVRGQVVQGLEPLLELARADAGDVGRFLAVGRIVTSERRNLNIELLPDGTARVAFDWWVELELRNVPRALQLTLPGQATALPVAEGWVFAGFRPR